MGRGARALGSALVALALAAVAPWLPSSGVNGPPLWPAAGVVVALILATAWGDLAAVLVVLTGAAVFYGLADGAGVVLSWLVLLGATGVAAGVALVRRSAHGLVEPTHDPLEILGVAAGAGLLAAAAADAFSLDGGGGAWAMALGLGILVAAPPAGRLLQIVNRLGRAAPASPPPPAPALVRVLVVEDDPVNRKVAAEMLRTAGCIVATADDGAAGVAQVAEAAEPFDLVLMDLHMPRRDGLSAVAAIRALPEPKRAGVPVVLLTADVTAQTRRRVSEAGFDAALHKPFERSDLLAVVRRFAGHPGGEDGGPGAEPPALPPDATADLATIDRRLRGLPPQSLSRILNLYRPAVQRHRARLGALLEAGDLPALAEEAHTLKGAASVIGAARLASCAAEIEHAARAADLATVGALLARLDGIVVATGLAVEAFARQRGARASSAPSRSLSMP